MTGTDPGDTAATDTDPPSDRHFGEQGGQLTYGSYLQLDRLLSAQVQLSTPPAHDELLFITIHQVYELWFLQLLHDLEEVRDAMLDGRFWWARHLLKRAEVVERVLISQIDVLETMTPQDFGVFRQRLAPASGFQSVQFRELEFLSGAKDPAFLTRFRGITETEKQRLDRRLAEPTLWDAYLAVLSSHELDVADDDAVRASLIRVAGDRGHYRDAWELGEGLVDHDERAAQWRARHVQMVERQIGTKSGTGGSSGAPYLRSRLPMRYYPLLWEMRDAI